MVTFVVPVMDKAAVEPEWIVELDKFRYGDAEFDGLACWEQGN